MPLNVSAMRRWCSDAGRAALAELVGTALLVALGLGAAAPRAPAAPPPPLTHVALAFGFAVTLLAAACGPASGAHLNPAVSLAAALRGRLAPARAALYAAAQCAGATLGFGLLLLLTPLSRPAGLTLPAAGVLGWQAAGLEALMTGALVLLACSLWAQHDPARPDHAAPLKVGLTVVGLVYTGGELTGASLNPARSLGPALLYGDWRSHWVYWLGPLAGAAAAAALAGLLLPGPRAPAPPAAAARDAPEELPLRDKAADV